MPQGPSRRARYEQMARNIAKRYGVPPKLFLSLIDHESSWKPDAVSHVGAVGLTQLMPGTARGLGIKDPWNPRQNLEGGARYLAAQFKAAGSWKDALRYYNVGPTGAKDPNAGLEYANSVLSGRNAQASLTSATAATTPYGGMKAPMGTFSKLPGAMTLEQMTKLLFPSDKKMWAQARKLGTPGQKFAIPPPAPGPTGGMPAMTAAYGAKYTEEYKGKTYVPGTSWASTHVTDGLDWNNGRRTAVDIMLAAGTPVGAPESGRIVRHGSAQGGSALYFMSDSGHLYWMGHIENALPIGTRVARGQPIAVISSRHAAPHLHIDRYYGQNPGQYA